MIRLSINTLVYYCSYFTYVLLEKFEGIDSNSRRRNTIVPLIKDIELAKNTKYKDTIKIIDWIYKDKTRLRQVLVGAFKEPYFIIV